MVEQRKYHTYFLFCVFSSNLSLCSFLFFSWRKNHKSRIIGCIKKGWEKRSENWERLQVNISPSAAVSCPVLFYAILSFLSCSILSCPSCFILFYPVLSFLFYPVLSFLFYPVLSCPFFPVLSCPFFPVLSFPFSPVLSCPALNFYRYSPTMIRYNNKNNFRKKINQEKLATLSDFFFFENNFKYIDFLQYTLINIFFSKNVLCSLGLWIIMYGVFTSWCTVEDQSLAVWIKIFTGFCLIFYNIN